MDFGSPWGVRPCKEPHRTPPPLKDYKFPLELRLRLRLRLPLELELGIGTGTWNLKDFGFEFDSLHPEHTLRAFGTVADILQYIHTYIYIYTYMYLDIL